MLAHMSVRWFRGTAILVSLAMMAAAAGCVLGGGIGGSGQEFDAWVSAGVADPRISTRTEAGRTTVTVEASTDLALDDADNRDGFAERVAKILWRTHLGPIDTAKVTSRSQSDPGSRRDRTWQRAELERAFGPRLAGLDEADEAAVRSHLPAGDGPYADKPAGRLPEAITVMEEIVQDTSDRRLGRAAELEEPEREACLDDFAVEETGEFRANASADLAVPDGMQSSEIVVATAEQWADMGLEVNRSGLLDGTEDRVRGELPDVGDIVLSAYPRDASTLKITYNTECAEP
jgi:hypothetical protein